MPFKAPRIKYKGKTRPNSSERGYDYMHALARRRFLALHPICSRCASLGISTLASVLDHIVPISHATTEEERERLRWDENNYQALCAKCHAIKTFVEKQ